MLKRNWKIFFVGISQLVDILAMLASAGIVVWLKRYPHLGTQTANNVLFTGFIIFVVVYITIAVMMGLYRGSFHLSLSLQNMIMVRAFICASPKVEDSSTSGQAMDSEYIRAEPWNPFRLNTKKANL
jgi:hypothetical protein